jgi:hypothetical protein
MTRCQQLRDRLLAHGHDRPVLRAITALWLVVSAIHITLWLLIAAVGGHLDQPWWLWVTVPLGLGVGTAWWLTTPSGS